MLAQVDWRGDPFVLAIAVQILGWVVGGGGGAAFTGTVLNVPLWMVLIAALFAAGAGGVRDRPPSQAKRRDGLLADA